MPIASFEIPQTGSFVAEPQYGGYGGYGVSAKWGASYGAAPPSASYQPSAESMYGSATPPFAYGYFPTYTSAPAPSTPSYQQFPMPSTASFTYEQPSQQTYQMPKTSSFTHEQQYSYQQQLQLQQQQRAVTQSSYGIPQQASFTAYPQPANYPSMGDMPQFQFYPSAAPGADRSSNSSEPMNHAPVWPGQEKPTGLMNHAPADPGQTTPAGLVYDGPAGPGRANSPMNGRANSPMNGRASSPMNGRAKSPMNGRVNGRAKSPMNKPNSSTSKRPPRTAKKRQACCSCGV